MSIAVVRGRSVSFHSQGAMVTCVTGDISHYYEMLCHYYENVSCKKNHASHNYKNVTHYYHL